MSFFRCLFPLLLLTGLNACSYMGTLAKQTDYSLQQLSSPKQRVYKHMLEHETYFVFGRVEIPAQHMNRDAIAVIALSDKYHEAEVVDVNHQVQAGNYYGLNLPAGDYRLFLVSDLNRDGWYDEHEILARRDVSLNEASSPDKVVSDIHIVPDSGTAGDKDVFHVAVLRTSTASESLFYPKGTIRHLDDPIFSPAMANLGLYEPAAFLEATPLMFYAQEEDIGHKIPVIFVHGINGSPRDFSALLAHLDRSRFKPWFFYYPTGMDLKQLSAMFHRIFLSGQVIQLGDEMPVIIVAHSMGGLIVREALNLQTGSRNENKVSRLITLASPLGGHPDAGKSSRAPLTLPSWRNLDPASEFIAGLHRKPLPAETRYTLIFAHGDERSLKLGVNSDGVVPLSSQLTPEAQKEAGRQLGIDDTHTGILANRNAIREVMQIVDAEPAPYPEAYMRALQKGGFAVEAGADYTPMEAFLLRNIGHFLAALASGELPPTHPYHQHFIRAVHKETQATETSETAWLKFVRDHPEFGGTAPLAPQAPHHRAPVAQ